MAYLDKLCEYSGESCGYDMYKWKRNTIQIMPQYRKLFRGCDSTFFYMINRRLIRTPHGYISYNPEYITMLEDRGVKYRVVKEWQWELIVRDEQLQGIVKGRYDGVTKSISTVKRKMKRLTRNYKLLKDSREHGEGH